MTLFKRHMGRRVAAVGVAVALLVLGLAAPAYAAAPTITAVTPTSAAVGCEVTITGTNFQPTMVDPPSTFDGDPWTGAFTIDSATQIEAAVPVGAGASTESLSS